MTKNKITGPMTEVLVENMGYYKRMMMRSSDADEKQIFKAAIARTQQKIDMRGNMVKK